MSGVCREGYPRVGKRAGWLLSLEFCQQLQLLGTSVSPRSSWHSPQQRTKVWERINTHIYIYMCRDITSQKLQAMEKTQ